MFRFTSRVIPTTITVIIIVFLLNTHTSVLKANSKLTLTGSQLGNISTEPLVSSEDILAVSAFDINNGVHRLSREVYVYKYSHDNWTERVKFSSKDFGQSSIVGPIAVSNNTLVIANLQTTTKYNGQDANKLGIIYIFVRNGSIWSEQTRITPPEPNEKGTFGTSVALDGNTLVVGEEDKIHVFVRDTATGVWSYDSKLLNYSVPESYAEDRFKPEVAISRDTIVVGMPGDYNRVVVFIRNLETGEWQQQAELVSRTPYEPNGFGSAVAIDGDTLVVGAHKERYRRLAETGVMYVFHRDPTIGLWTEQARLGPRGAKVGGIAYFLNSYGFARRAIIKNGIIAATASSNSADSGSLFISEEKAVYIFKQNHRTDQWSQCAKLISSAPEYEKNFASGVAIAGNTVLVSGTRAYNNQRLPPIGAVDLFDLKAQDECYLTN